MTWNVAVARSVYLLAATPLAIGWAQAESPPRVLPRLQDIIPALSLLSLPPEAVCSRRTDDPFAVRSCIQALTELSQVAARVLPGQRFLASGTLRGRSFDFEHGVFVFDLQDIDGDIVPMLYSDADTYLGALRPDSRQNMIPSVHSGALACKRASIPDFVDGRAARGQAELRYPTIVLTPWSITSPTMSETAARESPLREPSRSVELVIRLEQHAVDLCCAPSVRALIESARAPCSYSPWQVVVEEARAAGLPTLGFASDVVAAEGPPLLTLPW
jgi:hypothetical protein